MRQPIYEVEQALECSCFGASQQPNKSGIRQSKESQENGKRFIAKRNTIRNQSQSLDSMFNVNLRSKRSLRRQKPRISHNQYRPKNDELIANRSTYPQNQNSAYVGKLSSEYSLRKQLKSHEKFIVYPGKNNSAVRTDNRYLPHKYDSHFLNIIQKTQAIQQGSPATNHEHRQQQSYHSPGRVQSPNNIFPVKCEKSSYKHKISSVNQSNNNMNSLLSNNTAAFPVKYKIPVFQPDFNLRIAQQQMTVKQIESVADSNQKTNQFSEVICHDWTDRSNQPPNTKQQEWKSKKLSSLMQQNGKLKHMDSTQSYVAR